MKDFVFSAIMMALSLFIFIASEAFAAKGNNALSLAYNPAFYPRVLAFSLFIMACVLMFQSIRKGSLKNVRIHIDRQKLVKVLKLFLIVLLYIVGINYAGYIISSVICIFLSIAIYGGSRKQAFVYCIIITVALYLIFQIGFRIPLPKGDIFEYWR
ncbi:MAG: tripartite tricarboxylate transporter TctB family protein [Spirochaetales bacterium]|nr:tripartite tricarboxylate transporter TctB family protein [Spirochaetales bacterium]